MKRLYATASIVSAERIGFDIKGNDYRLVVSVDFEKDILWISGSGHTRHTTGSPRRRLSMASELKPIRNRRDYEAALAEVERLWGAKSGTPRGDRLDILATLIEAYEAKHYPMDSPGPIEAILFRMAQ